MAKHSNLPIMVGSKLGKGLLVERSNTMNGFDLYVVWLNKDYETGEAFEFEDIRNVNAVLHFCDKESVQTTIDALENIKRMWGD